MYVIKFKSGRLLANDGRYVIELQRTSDGRGMKQTSYKHDKGGLGGFQTLIEDRAYNER
jgi:hypothetical protein